ncbi:hypothetical protein J132_00552 [Termitomyces sp. J132]|nr:hypothetical protein H2248_009750 [Termitomyces sp. 'cryptogamus']KNZ81444.1 hypothetical protein J132_00552 [Termitomyces sp. J132]
MAKNSALAHILERAKDELLSIPVPQKPNVNQKPLIPKQLNLMDMTKELMEAHMDTVGLDKHIFQHTIEDQNHTFEKLVQLGIHIPNEIERDIRSKFSVCDTNKSPIYAKSAAKGEKGRELQHYV